LLKYIHNPSLFTRKQPEYISEYETVFWNQFAEIPSFDYSLDCFPVDASGEFLETFPSFPRNGVIGLLILRLSPRDARTEREREGILFLQYTHRCMDFSPSSDTETQLRKFWKHVITEKSDIHYIDVIRLISLFLRGKHHLFIPLFLLCLSPVSFILFFLVYMKVYFVCL